MPLQFMATASATHRINRYAQTNKPGSADLLGTPVGQVVGQMKEVRAVKRVLEEMVAEYVDSVEGLSELLQRAAE